MAGLNVMSDNARSPSSNWQERFATRTMLAAMRRFMVAPIGPLKVQEDQSSPGGLTPQGQPEGFTPPASQTPARRKVAVLAADVADFPKLLQSDPARTVADLQRDRAERLAPEVARCGGRIVNCAGEAILAEFASVAAAVECAVALQSMHSPCAASLSLKIGINLCDVIPEGDDIYGDGVNVAFRVERLAEPGGICITEQVYDSLLGTLGLEFADLGQQNVRNISRAIRVFRWRCLAPAASLSS